MNNNVKVSPTVIEQFNATSVSKGLNILEGNKVVNKYNSTLII